MLSLHKRGRTILVAKIPEISHFVHILLKVRSISGPPSQYPHQWGLYGHFDYQQN